MASESFAIHLQFDRAGLSSYDRLLETHSGKALEKLIDKAAGKALRPLAGRVKASERSSGIHNRTNRDVNSIALRKPRKRPGEVVAYTVGPKDQKAHLLIRGHRIVTPGGRDTGRRSRAFPYVDPPVDAEAEQYAAQLSSDVWASSIRPL
jgi:hypothetical protein